MKSRAPGAGGQTDGADGTDGTENWYTGPAWRDRDGRTARRRKRIRIGAGVAVAAGVAVLVLNPGDVRSKLPWRPGGDAQAEAASPAAPVATLEAPFAGSPAVQYADGAAGIVPPEAKPVGRLSKDEVADVLRKVKALLTDANLNPRTLRGDRPTAALDLIDPLQPQLRQDLETGLAKPDRAHDPLQLFTRFDPHEVRLVGDVVKTRGRMTFKEGQDGALAVHTDHTFVYPVVQAAQGASEVTRTVVRRVVDFRIDDPGHFEMTPGKLSLSGYAYEAGNHTCDVYDGFLHPRFTDGRPGPMTSGPATDPYDRSKDLSADLGKDSGEDPREDPSKGPSEDLSEGRPSKGRASEDKGAGCGTVSRI
ncbi:hypothetical protein [Streptomyces sp. NPDC052496]|uniref:hypothetical protein n=1 Tax=Streptomyces sp. NPDC052496 TaxID=3154951 RepID=UPI003441ED9B